MIKLNVKEVWKGCVAIRDKYYYEAMSTDQSIEITVDKWKQTMLITEPAKYAYKSKVPFMDKYSKTSHYLYYYRWTPAVSPVEQPVRTKSLF